MKIKAYEAFKDISKKKKVPRKPQQCVNHAKDYPGYIVKALSDSTSTCYLRMDLDGVQGVFRAEDWHQEHAATRWSYSAKFACSTTLKRPRSIFCFICSLVSVNFYWKTNIPPHGRCSTVEQLLQTICDGWKLLFYGMLKERDSDRWIIWRDYSPSYHLPSPVVFEHWGWCRDLHKYITTILVSLLYFTTRRWPNSRNIDSWLPFDLHDTLPTCQSLETLSSSRKVMV